MFPEYLQEYLPIILFLIIALGLSCAFVAVNFILSPKNPLIISKNNKTTEAYYAV